MQAMYLHAMLVLLVVVGMMYWQKEVVDEILYGALIFLVPNAYFTWQAFRFSGAARARQTTQSMYKGQIGKFVLTLAMFATVFGFSGAGQPWVIIASYGVNTVVNVILTATLFRQSRNYS